jgi:glutamate synthase (NADPH/NADH) large chain
MPVRLACEQEMERAIKAEGQVLLGWRDVPVNRDMPMSPTCARRSPSCARSSSAAATT